jgi:tetratricopeptide (TPR) repeat protein
MNVARIGLLLLLSTGLRAQAIRLESLPPGGPNASRQNALIARADSALGVRDWAAAEPLLRQLVSLDSGHWQFLEALGRVELALAHYDSAAAIYARGISIADHVGRGPADTATRTALGQMLVSQGNAYLKLQRSADAIGSYSRAAELDPNPGRAYFNLCATLYNVGNSDGALAACGRAIAADSTRADAYFIKGSLLLANASLDQASKKVVAPPGTIEALRTYLRLAPNGSHASDVKQMLEYLGVAP